jgi:hypothetical protein
MPAAPDIQGAGFPFSPVSSFFVRLHRTASPPVIPADFRHLTAPRQHLPMSNGAYNYWSTMTNSANPTRPPFKPTPEMIAAAENVFLAMTIETVTRPIVERYQIKILNEREWMSDPAMSKTPGMPERVTDPKYTWLMGSEDFALYQKRCNEERIAAKLPAETDDHCPLLVAENITRLAKTALLDTMSCHTNIDGASAAAIKTADYDKLVDITLRLLAPFVKNVLAALRTTG